MPVLLACPTCLQKIRAPETVVGRQIKCPQCKNPFMAVDNAASPLSTAKPAAARAGSNLGTAASADPVATDLAKSWSNVELADEADDFGAQAALRPTAVEESSPFVDFLLLKRALSPRIQVALFYLGTVAILVFCVVSLVASICLILTTGLQRTMGLLLLIGVTLMTPLAVVVWRVFCETTGTVFRIEQELRRLQANKEPPR